MILVIGGGPSGFMCALEAAKRGHEVKILEKKSDIGKKLLITGKGRCNLTNSTSMENILNAFSENKKFLYSSFKEFNNEDLMNLFTSNGLQLKVERGGRVFPVSDNGEDIVRLMKKLLRDFKVEIITDCSFLNLLFNEEKDGVIGVQTSKGDFLGKVVISTGGKSYIGTGSTGDGQEILGRNGVEIKTMYPSLVPLKVREKKEVSTLMGLSLKNGNCDFYVNKKKFSSYFGEMLFTHEGISGPIVLSASRDLVPMIAANNEVYVEIDLKPSVSRETLDKRILKVLDENKKKFFRNILKEFLPQKMIEFFIDKLDVSADLLCSQVNKEMRKNFLNLLKGIKFNIIDYDGYNKAIVTRGGISLKEINPKTMNVKKYKDLYAIGEVLDLDAFTGGYNLQGAFSTGCICGRNI